MSQADANAVNAAPDFFNNAPMRYPTMSLDKVAASGIRESVPAAENNKPAEESKVVDPQENAADKPKSILKPPSQAPVQQYGN